MHFCIVHDIIYDNAYTIDQVRHPVVPTVIASLHYRGPVAKTVNITGCVTLCICYMCCVHVGSLTFCTE